MRLVKRMLKKALFKPRIVREIFVHLQVHSVVPLKDASSGFIAGLVGTSSLS